MRKLLLIKDQEIKEIKNEFFGMNIKYFNLLNKVKKILKININILNYFNNFI